MLRYALKIEYDGAPFNGWQRQKDQPSVQGTVESALARIEPAPPLIAAAGRTDTGVHAFAQVAHCDLSRPWDSFRLSEALNHHLKPYPVAILAAAAVPPDFHARFSALERTYIFRLLSRRAPATFQRGQFWQVKHPLDLGAMQEAAAHLLGKHDFTTFRASQCQARSPVKTLDQATIEEIPHPGGIEYRFCFRARSFLHSQVRSMVGTIERVGLGALSPDDVRDALAGRDRALCGPVCPPQGLYLASVRYPRDPFEASGAFTARSCPDS